MLWLSRKAGEVIHVGDNITVHLARKNGKVLIGVEAPKEILVLRGELVEQPGQDKAEAA